MPRCLRILAVGVLLAGPGAALALEFNFNAAPGTDPRAIAGFIEAGQRWSALFTDEITVNIDFGFEPLAETLSGATILGSAGPELFEALPGGPAPTFTALKDALRADTTSESDAVAVANLPPGATLQALTNNRAGDTVLDADDSGNNTLFRITTANARALGLLAADDPLTDAEINFNSDINFDFDPSDGITPGAFDFVGVATHEIGHALGFISGVDLVDTFSGEGPQAETDLNGFAAGDGELEPFALFSTFDLFRRSEASAAFGADVVDVSTGDGVVFSIDGAAEGIPLETGAFNGTGQQASHFADGLGLGILDPTAAAGELLEITENDLLVFDVIGFDLNPDALSVLFEPVPVEGDINNDGLVNAADFTLLRDGAASGVGFAAFSENFGGSGVSPASLSGPPFLGAPAIGGSALVATPEPTACGLLTCASMGLTLKRRCKPRG